MSFGGFLGIGERYHPLPWSTLKYDTRQGGYVVGITIEQLKGGPKFEACELPSWGERSYQTRLHEHYKVAPTGQCSARLLRILSRAPEGFARLPLPTQRALLLASP